MPLLPYSVIVNGESRQKPGRFVRWTFEIAASCKGEAIRLASERVHVNGYAVLGHPHHPMASEITRAAVLGCPESVTVDI